MEYNIKKIKLFLSCPSDVKEEIAVVESLINEWNSLNSDQFKFVIQLITWKKNSYPQLGDRPQNIINKQILNSSDIVVGIFWTRFGTPTGKYKSGTEEEIREAILGNLQVMLYFSNTKVEINKVNIDKYKKVKAFKNEFSKLGLICTYNSITEFESSFRIHLNNVMLSFINKNGLKKLNIITMETKTSKKLITAIQKNFVKYFKLAFDIFDEELLMSETGIKVINTHKQDKSKVINTIESWEKEIINSSSIFKSRFDKSVLERFKRDSDKFKKNIFAKIPWTVTAALKNPDKELIRYRTAYANKPADEILTTVIKILNQASKYVDSFDINNFNFVHDPTDMKLKFLEKEDMLLAGVIGLGIRSELLNRYYPSHFAIMTRRSIWGMFFLSDNNAEFIRQENNKDGTKRTTHEWEYDYAKFTYLNNYIYEFLKSYLKKEHKLTLNDKYRFGYSGMFLAGISQYHQNEINLYTDWKE